MGCRAARRSPQRQSLPTRRADVKAPTGTSRACSHTLNGVCRAGTLACSLALGSSLLKPSAVDSKAQKLVRLLDVGAGEGAFVRGALQTLTQRSAQDGVAEAGEALQAQWEVVGISARDYRTSIQRTEDEETQGLQYYTANVRLAQTIATQLSKARTDRAQAVHVSRASNAAERLC